jgi:ATP-dependent exoDNAse (exonuclease V) alpha subunit
MAEAGRLGAREMVTTAGRFAAGDVVLVRRNAPRLDVSNGDRGVVRAVDGDGLYVRFDDRYRFLPRAFIETATRRGDPSVQHGYAITAYVAQGMTCRAAFVFARDDLYREWAHTALSRGREENRLYVIAESASLRAEIAPSEPTRDTRRALIDALGRSRPETMASELAQSQRQDSDRDIAR